MLNSPFYLFFHCPNHSNLPVSISIIRSQYFIYFGVMGIFLPYFNLYCYHIGFSGLQIGVLSGLRSAMLILFPLIWGALADRFQKRRLIYILCNAASAIIWSFYLLSVDFKVVLLITIGYTIFYAPVISFLEAFTVDILDAQKRSYGRVRVWGTIAFIVTVLCMGKMIDLYGIKIILILILVGSTLQACIAIKVPDIRVAKARLTKSNRRRLFDSQVMVFLGCAFLMLVSHGAYYGFFSIHLENLGYGKTFIGTSWALASGAEVVVMLKSDTIFKRFSIQKVLLLSFMAAALRWLILFFARTPYVILPSQILHAITYAAFHIAGILYIDSVTPKDVKTLGQALNNAITYGLGLMVGFLISGALYERIGSFNLFGIGSLIALTGGIGFGGFHLTARRSN